jgi:predicted 3-demethylubiquinone-9 3-methyltransferase (glyoxalase superfamily)
MNSQNHPAVVPHLWFDTQAVDAVEFYTSLFPESEITEKSVIKDTPSGDCDVLAFELWGRRFEAINAGPFFPHNPAISFMVNFDPLFFSDAPNPEQAAREKMDAIWNELKTGGQALMELGAYDFSDYYGWIQDRYGLTWQLILTNEQGDPRPSIMPSLLFVGDNYGKAAEAGAFYRSVFPNNQNGMLVPYPPGMEAHGATMFSDFRLGDTWITAMDSGEDHAFQFNESVSFIVYCEDQQEVDHYWSMLSAEPESEQCGWLKDKFGISWQIVPKLWSRLLHDGNESQRKAVTQAMLEMKKLDTAGLQTAFDQAE